MTSPTFTKASVELLARRAAYICSNTNCRVLTVGPNADPNKSTTVGYAAHVSGAKVGSARYFPEMTDEQRSNPKNGIWICGNCHPKVDKDELTYPLELLHSWKTSHEAFLNTAIGIGRVRLRQEVEETFTLERHEQLLLAAMRAKVAAVSTADVNNRITLLRQLDDLKLELADLNASHISAVAELTELRQKLSDWSGSSGDRLFDRADKALRHGDRRLADQIFASLEQKMEPNLIVLAEVTHERGLIANSEYRYKDAYSYFERATSISKTSKNMAALTLAAGRIRHKDYLRHARAWNEMRLAEDCKNSSVELRVLGALAAAEYQLGERAQASKYYKKMIDISLDIFGRESTAYSFACNSYSVFLNRQYQFDLARFYALEGLRIRRLILGRMHLMTASSYGNLAAVHTSLANHSIALRLNKTALHISASCTDRDHPYVAIGLCDVANSFCKIGNFEEAIPYYERSMQIFSKLFGRRSHDVMVTIGYLADALSIIGNHQAACALGHEAAEYYASEFGGNDLETSAAFNNLATHLQRAGLFSKALPHAQRAFKKREFVLG